MRQFHDLTTSDITAADIIASVPFNRQNFLRCLVLAVGLLTSTAPSLAGNPAVAPMIRLIEGGKLPEARLPTVIDLICKRGDAADLAFVFQLARKPTGISADNRLAVLQALAQAARERNLKPDGELDSLADLLKQAVIDGDQPLQQQSVELIGLWQLQQLSPALADMLRKGASPGLSQAILQTLAELGGKEAIPVLTEFTVTPHSRKVRTDALVALASVDLERAATAAADFLAEPSQQQNFNALLAPFLARKQGPELLGQAIADRKIPADTAKLILRSLLASGRNDKPLSDPLSAAAGLDNTLRPLSETELKALVARVQTAGDAARGEQVFRREELNCYKCHALGKAGSNIGPDLSAVGGSSPIDYLINSLLLPSQAIKEAYKTVQIVDINGLSHVGIVVDRDSDRVILRDAQGKEITIAEDDIEFEKEGESLMPSGLTKFLTDQEFLDLVKFLSALGKDPGYLQPVEPTVYRWRVYAGSPAKVTGDLFDDDSIRNMLFEYAPQNWKPYYAHAAGAVDLAEARRIARSEVIFAYAEVDVSVAGTIQLQWNSRPADGDYGIHAWWDNERLALEEAVWSVTPGRHRLLLRIDTRKFTAAELTTQLLKGPAPASEFSIVVGP